MNLLPMKYFIAVAEHQSISRAAKTLYLTQQTLSAHMAGLEKELMANLPDRPDTIEKVKKAYANFLRRKNNKIPEKA